MNTSQNSFLELYWVVSGLTDQVWHQQRVVCWTDCWSINEPLCVRQLGSKTLVSFEVSEIALL